MKQIELEQWAERADSAQEALDVFFWNEDIGMYDIETPCPEGACNTVFHYWWMAHAVDVLVDGLLRTGAAKYRERLSALHGGCSAAMTEYGPMSCTTTWSGWPWPGFALIRQREMSCTKRRFLSSGRISEPAGTAIRGRHRLAEIAAGLQEHPGQCTGCHPCRPPVSGLWRSAGPGVGACAL